MFADLQHPPRRLDGAEGLGLPYLGAHQPGADVGLDLGTGLARVGVVGLVVPGRDGAAQPKGRVLGQRRLDAGHLPRCLGLVVLGPVNGVAGAGGSAGHAASLPGALFYHTPVARKSQ